MTVLKVKPCTFNTRNRNIAYYPIFSRIGRGTYYLPFTVHQTNIQMDGFRHLNENDIVDFEVMAGKNGREQAANVKPVLTIQMIKDALREENLYVDTFKDTYGVTLYRVFDANHVIQTSEQGLPFLELAAFTGFSLVEEESA